MTARPEVVALLTDFDVERADARQGFVPRDGRPGQLAAVPQRLTELSPPYIRAVAEDMGDRRPPAEVP